MKTQGRSGLGLESQSKAIDGYAAATGAALLGRFTEVESGRKNDRPELENALSLARLTGATLVIATLDRLSRNAAFLSLCGTPASASSPATCRRRTT